jgi:hypothetical protein
VATGWWGPPLVKKNLQFFLVFFLFKLDGFADTFFTEWNLPKCNYGFAECRVNPGVTWFLLTEVQMDFSVSRCHPPLYEIQNTEATNQLIATTPNRKSGKKRTAYMQLLHGSPRTLNSIDWKEEEPGKSVI